MHNRTQSFTQALTQSFGPAFLQKNVPIHKMTWGYYTGGLVLLFLLVQVITGLLLLFYYQATVNDAYTSVKSLVDFVPGGALIRNMHAWSSSMMIFFAVVHMLTTFSMKAFASPRQVSWITGVLLLFVTFAFGFTGYLLPWNQLSVNATKVLLESIDKIGAYLPDAISQLPTSIRQAFQGETNIGQSTLSRFFALHVVVLPFVLMTILAVHLLCVQIFGPSQGVEKASIKTEKFMPVFFARDLRLWSMVFFVLYVLSLCIPFDSFLSFPLLAPYDASGATPVGIKPEWYFYFIYYPLELLPFGLVMLGLLLISLVLILVPWIFKKASYKLTSAIAILAGSYLFVITVFGQAIYKYFRGG